MGSLAATTTPGGVGVAGWVPLSRIFIARQPIFDLKQRVYGYELLPLQLDNVFRNAEPNQASARVMTDGNLLLGMEALSGGKLVFINVTRDILLNGYLKLLPRALTAAEILETIEPDPEIVNACSRLKKAGYTIVLDDFVYGEQYADLMSLADIVKVDFRPLRRRSAGRFCRGSKGPTSGSSPRKSRRTRSSSRRLTWGTAISRGTSSASP